MDSKLLKARVESAEGPAMRTSAACARFSPAPAAGPLAVAIVGSQQWATAMKPS
ncbi:hypothetical protein MELE44368_20685 [Mycolicibacterium elephantis DSM 44368]|uniref:Uncharacterized protein n=1 Tax=Mycolicibacterium elephantis DSM 44368 TaxID=1335622 RepID=A0A439DT03_9MYCO|nr:hypothetical protein MELE44368_20685 [Mycolicibacterium elephantis DSM 44368]